MFEQYTFANIMERMLDRVPDDLDKREGSVIWDALAPAALELELAHIEMDYILNQCFAFTSDRNFLILRAAERGLYPESATPAVLKARFTPSNCPVVGKRFNLGELNFTVTESMQEEGCYQIVCETPGAQGNEHLGDMTPIEFIDGLESAVAVQMLIPGEDEEDTETFRKRYFASFDEKPFGGNVRDYTDKINAIEGVGAVKITPTWNGGGTVLATILDSQFNLASSTLIHNVQEIIDPRQDGNGDGLAPIGHVVTIDTSNRVTVNISLRVDLLDGYTWEEMLPNITRAMEDYLLELRMAWKSMQTTIVRISQIETRVLQLQGVVDVGETTINGSAANLTVARHDVPFLGVITHAT